jgi:hypothetical protein
MSGASPGTLICPGHLDSPDPRQSNLADGALASSHFVFEKVLQARTKLISEDGRKLKFKKRDGE